MTTTTYPPEAALEALADNHGITPAEAEDLSDEAFRGEYDSVEDYADQLAEDIIDGYGDSDNLLSRYFNLSAFARDLVLGGDIWTAPAPGRQLYIFDGNV